MTSVQPGVPTYASCAHSGIHLVLSGRIIKIILPPEVQVPESGTFTMLSTAASLGSQYVFNKYMEVDESMIC